MNEKLINVSGVVRRFGDRVAVDHVDLTLEPGSIVALVGPNGSGKTTLLKMLAGLLRPTEGSVRVLGLDPFRRRPEVMAHVRFAFAPPALYANLTARETLAYLASLGQPRSSRPSPGQIDASLHAVGLSDRANDRVRVFSFGMRQRLALALAMLPMPRLLVLDEPTEGLDPLAILELRRILADLRRVHGVAILLSSHLLIEVERLVDSLLVLHEGRSVFYGPPQELVAGGSRLRLIVEGNGNTSVALKTFQDAGYDAEMDADGGITLPTGAIRLDEADRLIRSTGLALTQFHEYRPSLEEALLERLRAEGNGRPLVATPTSAIPPAARLSGAKPPVTVVPADRDTASNGENS